MKTAVYLAVAILLVACGSPAGDAVRGVDVSHHQGPIDWPTVKAQGMDFAYVKATEGESWLDPLYARHLREARQAGLLTGSYHFFSFCKGGTVQARNFLSRADFREGDLLPVVDVESMGNCTAEPDPMRLHREVKAFLDTVETVLGHRPLIYTTAAFHFKHMGPEFSRERFWLRNLFWRPGRKVAWVFWQHAVEELPGVEGEVDQNAFAFGAERLDDFTMKGGRNAVRENNP